MRMSRSQVAAGAAGGLALLAVGAGPASAGAPPASAAVSAAVSAPVSAPVSAAVSAPAAAQRCAKPLPSQVLGDPGLSAGAASGARVWHDATGWHIRFTHPGTGPEVFTGVIRSPQPITVRGYRLEGEDSLRLRNRGRTVTFRLVNRGAIDGIDLTDRCAINTSFTFYRDGRRLATGDVLLGAQGAHPTSNPFVVQRHR